MLLPRLPSKTWSLLPQKHRGPPQLLRPSSHSNPAPAAAQNQLYRSSQICSASYEDYAGGGPQRPVYGSRGGYGGRGGGGQRTQGRPDRGPRSMDGGPQGQRSNDKGGRQTLLSPEQQAAYREVRDAINSCKNWRDLASVVEAKSSIMDAENISNVMVLLTWDGRPQDPEERAGFDSFLSTLMGWCLALMPTFAPNQTVKVLNSMAKLQLYSEELIGSLVEKVIEQLGSFRNQEYGQIAEALNRLGVTPDARFVTEFCTKTLPSVPTWFHDILGSVLSFFVRTGVVPNPDWMEAAAAGYAGRARFFGRERFVDLLVLMGTTAKETGWQPSQELLDRILEGSRQLITPQPSAMGDQRYGGRGSQGGNKDSEGGEQRQGRTPPRVRTVLVSDYTRLLWALSNFSARPSSDWYATLYSSLARQQRYWTPEDIGAQAMYLGRYLQAPLTREMADRLQVSKVLGLEVHRL
ncbi:hypothetical protein DUNSADRAFT_8451 [Dunaliella salina]|uniref:Uncharacterized protein n=1 Tax=Dunaliella salina TaxID=3046 RepID=A0ABQ7GJI6_DUNSA|nr:hypothetical protein DUNSADRAFT_8451 [Dunaliella salina]|eukprot:KAF5834763.1 hypothetical protein DUNSADRAFT_8451 [Dunaliella salina]